MGRLILLPFIVHPAVPDIPDAVRPLAPLFVTSPFTEVTRDDVIAYYRRYLGRDPEDEGVITGRLGRSALAVELEIATSPEAIAYVEAHGIQYVSPTLHPTYAGLTSWSVRAGQLIADEMARALGMIAPPAGMALVLATQAQLEDAGGDVARSEGAAHNNPLNLVNVGQAEAVGTYLGRFAAFASLEDGARACALNYTIRDSAGYYVPVVDAFRRGDVVGFATAIDESPWNAGGYGGRIVAATRAALGV